MNSKGVRENITEEMKAFLDFLENKESESHLTKRIQEEVENARHQEEWRHEYMTLTEKYEEYFEEGREEGREEGSLETLASLISKDLLTVEQAAAELGVSVEEFQKKLQEN